MGKYQKYIYRNLSGLSGETVKNLEQILASEYAGRYSIEKTEFGITARINTTNAKWLSLVQRAEEMTHGESGRYIWIRDTRETKVWIPEVSDKVAASKALRMAKDNEIAFCGEKEYEIRLSDDSSWIPDDCIKFYVH